MKLTPDQARQFMHAVGMQPGSHMWKGLREHVWYGRDYELKISEFWGPSDYIQVRVRFSWDTGEYSESYDIRTLQRDWTKAPKFYLAARRLIDEAPE